MEKKIIRVLEKNIEGARELDLSMFIRSLGVVLAVVIASIVIWNVSIFAKSASDRDERMWDEYYLTLENEYKSEVRAYLNEQGFENAGIMLTHTTSEEGNRVYTLKAHHIAFDKAGEEAVAMVEEKVKIMGFEDERCTFEVVIN